MNALNKKWIWIAGVAVLMLTTFWMGRASKSPDPAEGPTGENEEVAIRETSYYCPMHPGQTSTNPDATCPICGMDLVAGDPDDDDDSDLPVLRLSERAVALMNIQVAPVERRTVEMPIHFLGRLEPDETLLREVVLRSAGYVEKLYANHLWQPVSEDEPLAEIYSPDVQAAARELLVAGRSGRVERGDRTALASAENKLRRMGVSPGQIEEILETGEVPKTYQVRSPKAGHVMRLAGSEGIWLAEGDSLLQIMDPEELWVQLEVYERDLPWLRPGLPVELSVEAFPGEIFEGEISFIDPHLNPRSRTARARVEVPNPDHRLKPEMFARGTVQVEIGSAAGPPLVIPVSAPLITGREAIVYVKEPDAERPTFEGLRILLGPRAGDYYVIEEGLEEGELVVVNGAFKIDSELQIRGRPSMMTPEREPPQEEVVDYKEPLEQSDFAAEVPASFGQELQPLMAGYLEMTTALADDDVDGAFAGLKTLHDELLEIGQHRLESAAHAAWMERYDRLHQLTHEATEAEDVEGLRDHLQELTREMEIIVIDFGAGQFPVLYRMYCPMAFDDQGATWLQDHDAVENPYFGEMMFRCGESLTTLGPDDAETR